MSTITTRPDDKPERTFREELDQLHAEIAAMRLELAADAAAHERLHSEVRSNYRNLQVDRLIVTGHNGVVEIGEDPGGLIGYFGVTVNGRAECRDLSASMTVDDGLHSIPTITSATVLVSGMYGNVETRATSTVTVPPAVTVSVDIPGAGAVAKLSAHHSGFDDGAVGVVDLDGGWHGALLLDDDRPGNQYVLVTYDQLDVARCDGKDWDRERS